MNESKGKVLIVDDEPAIRRALHGTLYSLGFDIGEASSGDEAIALNNIVRYDVVLMDINMPGRSGIDSCRELRRLFPRLAILMLSVRNSEDDKVEALEAGADDYVIKPFPIRELTARIRAALRRGKASPHNADSSIEIGEIQLDPVRHAVYKGQDQIHLTPKEFDLLHYLMSHAGLPIPHTRLLTAVWGPEYANQHEYLRTYMRQLRKKLEDDPAEPKYLLTDSHVGYRFRDLDRSPA